MTDPRPEATVELLRRRAEQASELRVKLADVVGKARSDDTLVTARVDQQGLQDLVLDPKAMRLPSADLAESIVTVTGRARADFEARRKELATDLGAGDRPSLEESMAQLERLRATVESGHGDMRAVFERFRDQTER